jgi:hypothetical protein
MQAASQIASKPPSGTKTLPSWVALRYLPGDPVFQLRRVPTPPADDGPLQSGGLTEAISRPRIAEQTVSL